MKEIGIYIHTPFCKQKCFYCDFCSYANMLEHQSEYTDAVTKEIEYIGATVKSRCENEDDYIVKTIYFGGGTPSILDAINIKKILSQIRSSYSVDKNAEITIEVNPGTASLEKFKIYHEIGINRMSIGLQSTNEKLLKSIGRIHNYEQFLETYKMARNCGFANINVDLMIGLPNQTLGDAQDSLKKVLEINPEHISVYSLIVEEGTVIEQLIENKKIELPDEDTERKMYWLVKDFLEKHGYIQYEISNFSKKGYESKHNMDCWSQKEYLGFGVAASSYFNKARYTNISSITEYIDNINSGSFEKNRALQELQDDDSQMREYMIIGLRKIEGVSFLEFKEKFGVDLKFRFKNELSKLKREELIIIDKDNVCLSKKGLDFANIVWEEFI